MIAEKLKKSILQEAIQGRLVPQNPEDEPASVLLDKIRAKKRKLLTDGEIKKEPLWDNIEDLKTLPKGWAWCRLGEICIKIGSGSTPRGGKNVYSFSGIPFLRSQNILDDGINLRDVAYISEDIHKSMSSTEVHPKDILLNITGASLGRCALVSDTFPPANVSQHVTIIRLIDERLRFYIHKLLLSPMIQSMIWTRQVGMAREGLPKGTLQQFEIPLPPLDEQKRIVAALDELLPKVAEYQKIETKVHQVNISFPDKFRKSVLQSAVQGKLVPQNPDDEPASILLKRVREKRNELIKSCKIKKSKNESYIFRHEDSWFEKTGNIERCIDEEIPFTIPNNWAWERLGNIGTFIRGSGIKRSDIKSEGVGCVRYGEIYTTYNISFSEAKSFIDHGVSKSLKNIDTNDLLFTLTGENKEEIGKTVAYTGEGGICAGGDLGIYKYHFLNPLYLSYIFNSPYGIFKKSELGTGNIIVHISCDKLSNILVPIAPINEQQLIVNSIHSIFSIL